MRCYQCGFHKHRVGPCGNCGARGGPVSLSDMVFDEISFVRQGANQKAHIVLFKSDNPADEVVSGLEKSIARLEHAIGRIPIFKQATDPDPDALEKAITTINHALGKSETPEQASVDSLAGLAKSLQSQQPSMTREQAFAEALNRFPHLYDPDGGPPAEVAKQAEPELSPEVDGLAIIIQKSHPGMTREQAVLAALQQEPSWYTP
jgi:hypothetical protein